MLNRNSKFSLYPTAVLAALAVSVLVAFGSLIEAVAGMQSYI
jgi:hypothetical protein